MFEYWKSAPYRRMIEQKVDARIAAAVVKEGYGTLAEFIGAHTETDMLRIPGLGRKSVDKIVDMAKCLGLSLGASENVKPNVRPITAKKAAPSVDYSGQKWEYLVVDQLIYRNRKEAMASLNAYGNFGWELIRVSHRTLIFKRPAP